MTFPPSITPKDSLKKSYFNLSSLLKLVVALVLAFLINQISVRGGDFLFYDLLMSSQLVNKTSDNIVLVYIDKNTVQNLKKKPGLREYNQFLKNLSLVDPSLIAFDIELSKIEGTLSESKEFLDLAKKFKDFLQISKNLTLKEDKLKEVLPFPFEAIQSLPGVETKDISTFFTGRPVTRRVLLNYQNIPLFHYVVAQKVNPKIQNVNDIQGSYSYLETDQVLIDFVPTGQYPRYNFIDILNNKFSKKSFQDKIILIGVDLDLDADEYISTPMSYSVRGMTRLEMHANMIDTLIKNNAPFKYPEWLRYLTVFILSILVIYIVLSLPPVRGLIFVGSLFFIITFVGWIVFNVFHLWLPLWHAYLTLFLCYYFFIPYRLILENRRSWEYYEKNKLLKQVEELKTNFISMMSHDLKTPIARIQGMSDVILQDPTILSHQQRDAIDTIKQSGEDLLKFINSILEYAKIESEGIKLHYESRDINTLTEDVLKKFEFHAKIKKIKVQKNLEPLFPIPMDPNLMKQVISNLIENAIKYSPENSTIHISTVEENSKVLFKVRDEGEGISEEDLPHVFDKFYRSHKAKISSVKGSGLGLYLAQYFIHMHGGEISVESVIGSGTTFTVALPIT